MSSDSYSVYFTGRFLAPASDQALLARLKTLFPHAPDDRLKHFLSGERLLLAQGEPLEVARQLVRALAQQDLECELVADPQPADKPQLHAQPAARLLARKDARALRSRAPPDFQPGKEDELTPWERRALLAGALGVAGLLVAAVWLAWRAHVADLSLTGDGSDIPSICTVSESSELLGSASTLILKCSASNSVGRYRLAAKCKGLDQLQIALAFFDLDGTPRKPEWRALPAGVSAPKNATGYLPIQYGRDQSNPRLVHLFTTAESNAGLLERLDRRTVAGMLTSSTLAFGSIFPGEPIAFDLGAATWYTNHFVYGCGLATPPNE